MSLQRRLLLSLGLALTLLWLVAAGLLFVDLRHRVIETLDQRLAASARMVAGLVSNRPELAEPGPEPARIQAPGTAGVACQVRAAGGRVLLRTESATGKALATSQPGYSTRTIDGRRWRLYTLRHKDLVITTADRMTVRRDLERRILLVMVAPFLLALVGGLLALWVGIHRGLLPMRRLREALGRRRPESLEPVALSGVPPELRPVVDTANDLLERVRDTLERERRFTSNAAHELRTPLTGIKTHLQLARRQEGSARDQAIGRAEAGAERLRHRVGQLLTLARVENEGPDHAAAAELDAAVRDAVADLPDAARLTVTGLEPGHRVAVPAALVSTALRNLLANALYHTPANSRVELTVEAGPEPVRLRIEDEGSGGRRMAQEARTGRPEPRGARAGNGLGLTIVEAIAWRYGGAVAFGATASGGLVVTLTLPSADASNR